MAIINTKICQVLVLDNEVSAGREDVYVREEKMCKYGKRRCVSTGSKYGKRRCVSTGRDDV